MERMKRFCTLELLNWGGVVVGVSAVLSLLLSLWPWLRAANRDRS